MVLTKRSLEFLKCSTLLLRPRANVIIAHIGEDIIWAIYGDKIIEGKLITPASEDKDGMGCNTTKEVRNKLLVLSK